MPPKFPASPSFVLHCDTAVTEIKNNDKEIVVGTQDGRIILYRSDDYQLKEVIYKSQIKAPIISIIAIDDQIVVHLRCLALVLLKKTDNKWSEVDYFPTNFPGFCGAVGFSKNELCLPIIKDSRCYMQNVDILEDNRILINNRSTLLISSENATPICAISSNEGCVYIGDDAGALTIIENSSKREVKLAKTPIFSLASSSNLIAAGSSTSPLYLVSRNNLSQISLIKYDTSSNGISSINFSPSGSTLFIACWDKTIRGISLKSKKTIIVVEFHSESINKIHWIDDKRLAAASNDGKISIWTIS